MVLYRLKVGVIIDFFNKYKIATLAEWVIPGLIILGLVVLWEVCVRTMSIPVWQLLPTSSFMVELVASIDLLWQHTVVTVLEIVIGFAISLVVGLVLSAGIAYSSLLQRSIYPIVISSQTVPIIAIAPLLLIWVGYGLAPKVIIVAIICFYPIVVNTVDGLKAIDPDMVNMMRALGATKFEVFRKLQIPTALPFIFSGIKISISVSVIAAVIGEWVGASEGLGYLIIYSQPLFLTSRVFAAILILAVLGVSLFVIAVLLERLSMPWYFNEKRASTIRKL
ncbi:MAG: ABC transporter permease [Dehalococcoidia bacterium]|nr:ABC transporter permease [Dehalococcoidia bacterium]